MPKAPRRSADQAASLASAEALAQRSERARARSEHFASCFEKHCRGQADDPGFLQLLLEAAISPQSHPALGAAACFEAIARASAPRFTPQKSPLPPFDPAPLMAQLAPLCGPPAEPVDLRRDTGFGRGGPHPSTHPWERLAQSGWAEPMARALMLCKAPWAPELSAFALANGASAQSVKAAAAIAGWSPDSERSKDALERCLAARDAERLRTALSCGALAFTQPPPHPMAASPFAALSGASHAQRQLCSQARERMGDGEPFALSPFFEEGMMALLSSSEWAALDGSEQRAWAQRFWDDAFAAGGGEAPLSFEAKEALKAHAATGPSAWGVQRALEGLLSDLELAPYQTRPDPEREARCAALIKRAQMMMPLFRAPEPHEPPITPLCVRMIEFLGAERPARPIVERAIHKAMDEWAASSFGARALRWMEARSGQTHSAANALCSLPRSKSRDFSEPAARWLGALLAQGFDSQAKITPKSKSLAERAASVKSLAPLYAQAEAIALAKSAKSQAPKAQPSKARL